MGAVIFPGRGSPSRKGLSLGIPLAIGGKNRVVRQVRHLPAADESGDHAPGNQTKRDCAGYSKRNALDDLPAGESLLGLALVRS